jgi:hypothetical protein
MANRTDTHSAPSDVRALWDIDGETLDYAERAYRSWMEGAESVQSKAMSYWSAEMQKGIDAMNEIAKCHTAAEAFGIQARYATEAMQDFFEEGRKVIDQLATLGPAPWAMASPAAADEKGEREPARTRATGRRGR